MKPKYKRGQYLAKEGLKVVKILAVITNSSQPVYATEMPRDRDKSEQGTHTDWRTEFELDEDKYEVVKPDFKRYATLEPNDILRIGSGDEVKYVKILARAGDMALLSQIPQKEAVKAMVGISEQLKELTEGRVDLIKATFSDEELTDMEKHGTTKWAHNVASFWKTTEWLCLMNWPIVEE